MRLDFYIEFCVGHNGTLSPAVPTCSHRVLTDPPFWADPGTIIPVSYTGLVAAPGRSPYSPIPTVSSHSSNSGCASSSRPRSDLRNLPSSHLRFTGNRNVPNSQGSEQCSGTFRTVPSYPPRHPFLSGYGALTAHAPCKLESWHSHSVLTSSLPQDSSPLLPLCLLGLQQHPQVVLGVSRWVVVRQLE